VVGDERDEDEFEFVLVFERVGCVGVCFCVVCCESDERAAFVPHAW
jgi:hypothetical protein